LADAVSRVTHTASAAIRAGAEPDPDPDLRQQDDEVDALHRRLLTQLSDGSAGLLPDTTIDLTLLGRYYERIGDQALNAAGWRRDPVRAAVQGDDRGYCATTRTSSSTCNRPVGPTSQRAGVM